MNHFLSYAIPGIPYGCNYALIAVGLVLTFRATGVFNLAFGAQAFVAAFLFDIFVRSDHLPVILAFVLSVLVFSPLLGVGFASGSAVASVALGASNTGISSGAHGCIVPSMRPIDSAPK